MGSGRGLVLVARIAVGDALVYFVFNGGEQVSVTVEFVVVEVGRVVRPPEEICRPALASGEDPRTDQESCPRLLCRSRLQCRQVARQAQRHRLER